MLVKYRKSSNKACAMTGNWLAYMTEHDTMYREQMGSLDSDRGGVITFFDIAFLARVLPMPRKQNQKRVCVTMLVATSRFWMSHFWIALHAIWSNFAENIVADWPHKKLCKMGKGREQNESFKLGIVTTKR
jgi:hypothetical protein